MSSLPHYLAIESFLLEQSSAHSAAKARMTYFTSSISLCCHILWAICWSHAALPIQSTPCLQLILFVLPYFYLATQLRSKERLCRQLITYTLSNNLNHCIVNTDEGNLSKGTFCFTILSELKVKPYLVYTLKYVVHKLTE